MNFQKGINSTLLPESPLFFSMCNARINFTYCAVGGTTLVLVQCVELQDTAYFVHKESGIAVSEYSGVAFQQFEFGK